MKFLSLFSGIEAASVAFGPLGWEAVAFAEISPFPSAVLAHRFPGVPNLGDMTQVDWSAYRGKMDLVCGGPPCQAFSIAGLRNSMEDARGNLSLTYVRAIQSVQPRWCLTENVPGWLNTKDNAFGCFLAGLVGADAPLLPFGDGGGWPGAGVATGPRYGVAWRTLDAQYYGVPQRRRRVFVVGHFGDWRPAAQVLFESEGLLGHLEASGEEGEGASEGARGGVESGSHWDGTGIHPSLNQAAKGSGGIGASNQEIFSQRGGGLVPGAPTVMRQREGKPGGGKGPLLSPDLSLSLATGNDQVLFAPQEAQVKPTPIQKPLATNTGQGGVGIGNPGDPMFTLDTGPQHGVAVPPPAQVFDMRGNGDGKTSPTLTREAAGDRPSDYAPCVIEKKDSVNLKPNEVDNGRTIKADAVAKLSALREEVGEEAFTEWGSRVSDSLQPPSLLRQALYGCGLRCEADEAKSRLGDGALPRPQDLPAGPVREMWESAIGSPSQRRELAEQLSRELGAPLPKLPHQDPPAMLVRRLTPREAERLQGFPDDWTLVPYRGKPAADGPRYKSIGNSWAVPAARWIGARIQQVQNNFPPPTERSPALIPGPTEPSGRPSGLKRARAGTTMREPADGKPGGPDQ